MGCCQKHYLDKGAITVELPNLAFCHRVDCFRPRLPRANDLACARAPIRASLLSLGVGPEPRLGPRIAGNEVICSRSAAEMSANERQDGHEFTGLQFRGVARAWSVAIVTLIPCGNLLFYEAGCFFQYL